MWRGVLAGLGLGLLAGWLVWGHTAKPVEDAGATVAATDTPTTPRLPAPGLATTTDARGAPDEGTAGMNADIPEGLEEVDERPPPPDRSGVFRSGSRPFVRAASKQGRRLRPSEVEALVQRLDEAEAEKDRDLYILLLATLGRSGSEGALDALIAVAADRERPVPYDFPQLVRPYLRTTRKAVPAALARIESDPRSPYSYDWVDIVMAQGTPEEIDRALAGMQPRSDLTRCFGALMARELDLARTYLDRARDLGPPRVLPAQILGAFAAEHPEEGLPLLERAIGEVDASDGRPQAWGDTYTLLFRYLAQVSPETWRDTQSFLRGLRSSRTRMAALRALQQTVFTRGYDLSGLEDLRNTPAGLLRALADASPRPSDADDQLVELMGNLANLRVAITAENVESLAYIAERWPDEKVQKDLRAWAEAWRKRLASRDWR